jgi:hypothetical protein
VQPHGVGTGHGARVLFGGNRIRTSTLLAKRNIRHLQNRMMSAS